MSQKSYIVQLKDSVDPASMDKIKSDLEASGAKIGHTYDTVFKGFSVSLPENAVDALSAHPEIQHFEPDQEMHTMKKD
ncbi:Subtilisin cleaved region like protein [Schizosaccharomyces pombe]|uniref:Uncharacterized protein C338.12 n=1 Tax=Schizosaccharomyces pombe (strain 972 / ATCC 24843) TaxID=284812 RepID=YJZC_SCHPO|nr:putative proteinase B inhibitor Pbi2 [Schizosaccharomyces pombe]O74989.1 RecName: Full=Uncharacterized protein C338.12 [Schizosaccharomyces pombe 972h-]CAA19343.1 proteinase B inhibitor Pbi2 (predicted) [Schizosaccharomyces pombe]|eukprot:NP_588156.1 putative proteinase B inhibitor Pbi2 [Schizosaccharomyces pombe]